MQLERLLNLLKCGEMPQHEDISEPTSGAVDAGAYSVDALVTQPDGQIVGRAEAGWTADPAVDEFRTLKPNSALLESIASGKPSLINAVIDEAAGTESGRLTNLNPQSAAKK